MSRVQVLSAVQFGFAFFENPVFAGSDPCGRKKSQNGSVFFRKKAGTKKREKSLEISRFSAVWLAKRLFSSCGPILTTQHGRGRRIRTRDPRFWRPVLYQLSYTPLRRQYYSTHPAKKQGVSRKIRKLFCVQIAQQEPEAGDRQRKVFRKIRAAYPVQTKIRTLVNRQKSGSYTGGDKGSRTPDLLNAIQALSQLSYTPVKHRVTVHCHATRGYYITRQTVCQELFGKS